MFEGWIEEQGKYQRESFGRDLSAMDMDELLAYLDEMLKAASIEILSEAFAEFSWKSWAKSQFLNRDALVSEIVDALFFLANALSALHVTGPELSAKYRSKMNLNTARQIAGYDGVDGKCSKCRRALDDEAVTCTTDACSEDALL